MLREWGVLRLGGRLGTRLVFLEGGLLLVRLGVGLCGIAMGILEGSTRALGFALS